MRILHLSWEFPPKKIGGLATALHGLVGAQAQKHEVHVVTCGFDGCKPYERKGKLHIHRFDSNIPSKDFLSWALSMNMYMKMSAADVINKYGKFDLVHAHDWLSALAAFFVKYTYRVPLVSTIHSTEHGRRQGVHESYQRVIHDVESKLVYESWRVITCSHFMKYQVMDVFNCPGDKIDVVGNGVLLEQFTEEFNWEEVKSRFALPHERIILFVGRMVPEKGCDVLVGAARFVLPHHPNVKFICVGSGYMRDKYLDDSRFLGVHDKFYFPGYIDDRTLHALMRVADAVVVPSRYEPFGIVALEAMAARTPVVVSDTGGLSEVVEHDKDGLKVWAGHSESLAWGINRVLGDHGHSQWLVSNAFEKVKTVFNWKMAAGKTDEIYTRVLSEYHVNRWKPKIPIDMSSHS